MIHTTTRHAANAYWKLEAPPLPRPPCRVELVSSTTIGTLEDSLLVRPPCGPQLAIPPSLGRNMI
jgi:hypothetical protein